MVGIGADEDISGRRIGEFSPPWAREHVRRVALGVARREGVWRGNLARLHRDGHEIPVSQVIVARTDEHGEIEFYATIARDMTRERAAEAALLASEERFRVAFEQAPVGMALLDLEGRYVQLNDASCRTLTWRLPEIENVEYTDGLAERRDESLAARLEQLRETVAGAPAGLDARLEHVTATLMGDGVRFDDVGLLALRLADARAGDGLRPEDHRAP